MDCFVWYGIHFCAGHIISVNRLVAAASPFTLSPVVVVVVHFGSVAVAEGAFETATTALFDEEENKCGNQGASGDSCTYADASLGSCG